MIQCKFENDNQASLRHVVVDGIVRDGKKILLVKRAKHLSNGGKWAIVGGFVDRDETCEDAIKREVKEETNLDVTHLKLIRVNDNPNRINEDRQNIAFVYDIRAKGELKGDDSEVEESKWFDFDKIPDETDFAFDHYDEVKNYIRIFDNKLH